MMAIPIDRKLNPNREVNIDAVNVFDSPLMANSDETWNVKLTGILVYDFLAIPIDLATFSRLNNKCVVLQEGATNGNCTSGGATITPARPVPGLDMNHLILDQPEVAGHVYVCGTTVLGFGIVKWTNVRITPEHAGGCQCRSAGCGHCRGRCRDHQHLGRCAA